MDRPQRRSTGVDQTLAMPLEAAAEPARIGFDDLAGKVVILKFSETW